MTRKPVNPSRLVYEAGDYDSAWKDVIEELFEPFLAFYFPHIHQDIDFFKGYTFLSKELRKIAPDSKVGNRYADELVKVYLKSGSTGYICIFIHVEVQGARDTDFLTRMYVYQYRIFDKFRQEGAEVISLAILTDEDPSYRPDEYRVSRWGFELKLKIPVVKLIDYRLDEVKKQELESSENPMAMVVMAHFKSQEIKKARPESKFSAKTELIRQCYRRGYGKEQIRTLLKFIDWIIRLPDALEGKISDEIISIEKEYKMPYVTTWERRAREEGLQEGVTLGREEGVTLGREEGVALGIKKGAHNRNIEIARKLLRKGIALDIISETTGLSRKEIEALAVGH